MESETAFSLRKVEYAYPNARVPALAGVDLDIGHGEWVVLLGENGSGKSTLARVLNALLLPTQGACYVYGLDTAKSESCYEIRQQVAMVFQNPDDQIVASIVEEDIAFGPENLGLHSGEIRRRVDWALEVTELQAMKKKPVYVLSGGQKQRLAIAGALALLPRCLVLDEITAMLDPQGRRSIIELLRELNKKKATLIQITHRLEETLYADRIIVMERGVPCWTGTPDEFFNGVYRKFNFETPSCLELHRLLVEKKLVAAQTPPEPQALLNALCQSLSIS